MPSVERVRAKSFLSTRFDFGSYNSLILNIYRLYSATIDLIIRVLQKAFYGPVVAGY